MLTLNTRYLDKTFASILYERQPATTQLVPKSARAHSIKSRAVPKGDVARERVNMHLHGHLKQCVLDFGPVYSFWLFSFERMNGILGAYHTNCRDIPLQVMRRFLASEFYNIHNWPTQFKDELSPLLVKHKYENGSLLSTSLEQCLVDHKTSAAYPRNAPEEKHICRYCTLYRS